MTLTVAKVISVVMSIVGISFLLPIITALCCGETQVILPFVIPMVISVVITSIVLFVGRNKKERLSIRSSISVVALSWIAASLMGAIPLYFTGATPTLTNALFESVSGITTTGASNIPDVEILPRSINLWRCETHWLGGMGIVALTVALLPMLGIGGFQLIKAETTGPDKGKFTAQIKDTAKWLWIIYFAMTVIHAILLKIAGMDVIDSITHAFSTMGTGGFSSRNASIASWNSLPIDIVCTIFMFLAGINFSLYYHLLKGNLSEIKKDTELKVYISIVLIASIGIAIFQADGIRNFFHSFRYGIFQTLAIATTTGYSTKYYTDWKPASQFLIFILFFIGGSAGSTSGGFKVIRWTVFAKQLHNEMQRMLHPHGIFTIRINKMPGRKDVVFNVSAFLFIYLVLVMITTFLTCLFGIDIFTSFTGALTMVGNVGPAFGNLGPAYNCADLPNAVKWIYCFVMLAGRLEIYTMLIYFFPSYWEK